MCVLCVHALLLYCVHPIAMPGLVAIEISMCPKVLVGKQRQELVINHNNMYTYQ